MDVYETLVSQLLTRNDLGMVCPQFDLRASGWHASVDFLAFDLVKGELALVEVSSTYDPSSLIGKAKRIAADQQRLTEWLSKTPLRTTMPIRFIGFVWDTAAAYRKTAGLTEAEKALICFVDLKDIVNLGESWSGRQHGFPIRDEDRALAFPSPNDRS